MAKKMKPPSNKVFKTVFKSTSKHLLQLSKEKLGKKAVRHAIDVALTEMADAAYALGHAEGQYEIVQKVNDALSSVDPGELQ